MHIYFKRDKEGELQFSSRIDEEQELSEYFIDNGKELLKHMAELVEKGELYSLSHLRLENLNHIKFKE